MAKVASISNEIVANLWFSSKLYAGGGGGGGGNVPSAGSLEFIEAKLLPGTGGNPTAL